MSMSFKIEPVSKKELDDQENPRIRAELDIAISRVNHILRACYKNGSAWIQSVEISREPIVLNTVLQQFRQAGWTITPNEGTIPPYGYRFS